MADHKSRPPARWRLTSRTAVGILCLAWLAAGLLVPPRYFPAHPSSWVLPVWLIVAVLVPWAAWILASARWPTPSDQKVEQKRAVAVEARAHAADERLSFYHEHGGRCQVCDRAVKESGRNWAECPHCHALVCWTCQKEAVTSAGSHLALCPVCSDMIGVTEVPTTTTSVDHAAELFREAEKRVVQCAACGKWDEEAGPQKELEGVTWEAAEQALGDIPAPARRIGKLYLCPRCLASKLRAIQAASID